jgi:hypothetical protein
VYPGDDEPLAGSEATFRAKITGASLVGSVNRHAWVEVVADGLGVYTVPAAARLGSAAAGWLRGLAGARIPDDTIVWAALAGYEDGKPYYDTAASAASAPAPSGARVTHGATQPLAVGINYLAFNGTGYDTDSYHDSALNNSRLTALTDGLYHMGCTFALSAPFAAGNWIVVEIQRNRTATLGRSKFETTAPVLTCHADFFLTAGDYVEVMVQPSVTVTVSAFLPFFWISRYAATSGAGGDGGFSGTIGD